MFWKYGDLTHENGEVLVTAFTMRRLYSPRGILDRVVKTAVIEGEIIASGQTAIEARRTIIDNAYRSEVTSAMLLKDTADGGQPTYQMSFPRVLDFVWLQEEHKAHFATGLPFRAVLESEELATGGLIAFSETLTKIGNAGPRTVWPELDNGPSIPQIVSNHTNVTIIQSGEIIGLVDFLTIPPSPHLYPLLNLDNPSSTFSHTLTNSDIRPVYTTRWNYVFTFNSNEALLFPTLR